MQQAASIHTDKKLSRTEALEVLHTLLDQMVRVKDRIGYLSPRRHDIKKVPAFKRDSGWQLVYNGLGGALELERKELEELERKLGDHVKKYFPDSILPL
ncbi:hypothetical protein QNI19_16575 [Cytophagaceae bacterium DM2B3-1]|uniref:Uncharacterized protein n=1 Tax=Xanthocytophaga flava TaxID=3048013 RepID=A0ABT7CLI6_9BACT|nr:hypothetical protein [Xanthocytophaga flavus]MDJ1494562.1 hypothetical protein [Xanthocytophaga flavus]